MRSTLALVHLAAGAIGAANAGVTDGSNFDYNALSLREVGARNTLVSVALTAKIDVEAYSGDNVGLASLA